MRFEEPAWFAALALIALAVMARLLWSQSGLWHRPKLLFSKVTAFAAQSLTWRVRARRMLGLLRLLAAVALVIAIARPQVGRSETVIRSEGIDIVLAIDHSLSMSGEDFGEDRTRLEHVTDVVRDFVEKRRDDRIGIVTFAAAAYTRCPMTLDVGLVSDFMQRSLDDWLEAVDSYARKRAGLIDPPTPTPREKDLEGTAIGDGLLSAVARLEDSDAKSKVVILLSDGEQTAGETSPQVAAELAKRFDVKVYAVGAGSNRDCVVTLYDRFGRRVKSRQRFRLDEETLREIAETTGGRYFHASDRESLEEVYEEIDRLERSEIESRDYREWDEKYAILAWAALGLLMAEALLGATVLRSLP